MLILQLVFLRTVLFTFATGIPLLRCRLAKHTAQSFLLPQTGAADVLGTNRSIGNSSLTEITKNTGYRSFGITDNP
jgi:hypothetical protein